MGNKNWNYDEFDHLFYELVDAGDSLEMGANKDFEKLASRVTRSGCLPERSHRGIVCMAESMYIGIHAKAPIGMTTATFEEFSQPSHNLVAYLSEFHGIDYPKSYKKALSTVSPKVKRPTAKKILEEHYMANKEHYSKNIKEHRETIIAKLESGFSATDAFAPYAL